MDTGEVVSAPGYELNNNMEFLNTPVRNFAKFEYKKLQTFVAAMGLPSNLKRKQLLAIIVAKKMGKDNMIPAILKEVTRQRNQKKKYVREVIHKHKLNDTNRPFPPKIAPLPPQVISNRAIPISNSYMAPLNNPEDNDLEQYCEDGFSPMETSNQAMDSNPSVHNNRNLQVEQRSANEHFLIATPARAPPQTPALIPPRSVPSTSRGGPHTYAYYYDANITKKYSTLPLSTYITTRRIMDTQPNTKTTPWFQTLVNSTQEGQSSYVTTASNNEASSSKVSQNQNEDNSDQLSEQLVDAALRESKKLNKNINLDEILDFVMDEENKDNAKQQQSTSNLNTDQPEVEASASNDSDSEQLAGIYDFLLYKYYSTLANSSLWPLSRNYFTYNNQTTSIFDVLSPIKSDSCITFSPLFRGISSPYEVVSYFRPRTCIFPDSYGGPLTVPDRCLLQPELSLMYDVPRMYYQARNYEQAYNAAHALSNYCYQASEQQDLSRFAYSSPQIHYNVYLPIETRSTGDDELAVPGPSTSYVEMRPRPPRTRPYVQEMEATIPPLSAEEETLAYNSLEDINSIHIPFQDTARAIHHAEHEGQCFMFKISCPFMFTFCQWFDSIPAMAQHIRIMHSEKIVAKKCAEYYINFIQLEMLREKGVKIIQQHANRLFYISLCYANGMINITIQELCESVEQHGDKLQCMMVMKHQSGNRVWCGYVNRMTIPLSQLWKQENSLIIPLDYLKSFQSKHFRLLIDIGI